jgi:integrase
MRGDGRVFQPTKDRKPLGVWYYEIHFEGRRKRGRGYRTRAEALAALKQERKRKARGEFVSPEVERLTVGEILDAYLEDLRSRGAKSVASVACRINRLKEAMGFRRALDLRTGDVEEYRKARVSAGLDKATVDREIEVARAAFRSALKRERLPKIPYFPMFGTDNVRSGFYTPEQTEAIIAAMPDDATKEIVRFVSLSGWRIGEVLPLRWESVDVKARQVHLGTTKNGRPRTLTLTGELLNLIERRWRAREYRKARGSALSAYVFHRRGGRPVSYSGYRRAFVKASADAGIAGRWTHDFRRSVARDLRRLGISETVCMSVTGHETPSMFRRYAGIIDPREQEAALAAREVLLADEKTERSVSPFGR